MALAIALGAAACADSGGDDAGPDPARQGPIDRCDWPMWGHGVDRTFSYPCDTRLSPATAADLSRIWFFNAEDTVTATPAVVDDTVYVGDWSGNFYALALADGELRWKYETEVHPTVYAGQIVSSAAVADVDGTRTVYFGAGKTLYALRARDGSRRWKHELGAAGDGEDPTEIEASPVVVDNLVIFGSDVHNSDAGEPAGVYALDATTGEERWVTITAPTEGDDATGPGCGDVWGSPSVDRDRALVYVGTGNCVTDGGWGRFSEAVVALDLADGSTRWTYQPHDQNQDDLDFAGAPNLFTGGDRPLVGLGNKDAAYYALDPDTGAPVWETQATEAGIPRPGGNFSTGGFIGPTAVADGVVVGGTAVGGTPYLHAFDAATGAIRWQQPVAAPTYAAAAEANGVVLIGGTDFTLRALDLQSGEVLWSEEMMGAVAGGAVVVGDDVVAVAGIREPGRGNKSTTSGVYRFSLDGEPVASTTTTGAPPTTADAETEARAAAQPCLASACPMNFDLTADRVGGDTGSGTIEITLAPFSVRVQAEGLGSPGRWLRPGSSAAATGASEYAVYLSQGTDNPIGGLVCVLDENFACTGDEIPNPGVTYDRISVLAVDDTGEFPPIAEGFDRLVTTNSFEIPFAPREK
ncbi:MAG: PQQ-binding-like beta-propeller repeat protein [Acidimicrobiia bacterium]